MGFSKKKGVRSEESGFDVLTMLNCSSSVKALSSELLFAKGQRRQIRPCYIWKFSFKIVGINSCSGVFRVSPLLAMYVRYCLSGTMQRSHIDAIPKEVYRA